MMGQIVDRIDVYYDDNDVFEYTYNRDTKSWECESIPEDMESREIITALTSVVRIEAKRLFGEES